MNNPQRTVFIMLAAILLLEFGSLTKFQNVWTLAFTGNVEGMTPIPGPGSSGAQLTIAQQSVTPAKHPTGL